jgi:GcrA cell cycle regulator
MEWTEEIISKLRGQWAEGLSTAEISRRLNISKNAVVGKAHRLNLPPRPSPIRRGAESSARQQQPRRLKEGASTLPPLTAEFANAGPSMMTLVLKPMEQRPRATLRSIPCAWPIGEPGKPSFHFCNAGAEVGKPYCGDHAAIAYVRVRDRREDANEDPFTAYARRTAATQKIKTTGSTLGVFGAD